jgi:hypothetical protein
MELNCPLPRHARVCREDGRKRPGVRQHRAIYEWHQLLGMTHIVVSDCGAWMAGIDPAITLRDVWSSYTPPLRSCPRIGSERRRLPVAAKIALVTAGWIMVAPGSPIPPHRLPGVGDM